MPVSVAVFSAVLWGLWWIPIRHLDQNGFGGALAGFAMNSAALPVVLVVVFLRRSGWQLSPRGMLASALVGVAVTTYATALAYADVVKVVLLFYLAPAWSTLIECSFMGRKWTWQSLVAVAASLGGMLLILGRDLSWSGVGPGEAMALASGMAWSMGAALLFMDKRVNTVHAALVAVIAAVATGGLAVAAERLAGVAPSDVAASLGLEAIGLAALTGGLYFAPMIALTLWSARLLPPALMSFLLSAEIISGVASSALLLDERFGAIEVLGTLCIVSGAVIEFVLPARRRSE